MEGVLLDSPRPLRSCFQVSNTLGIDMRYGIYSLDEAPKVRLSLYIPYMISIANMLITDRWSGNCTTLMVYSISRV